VLRIGGDVVNEIHRLKASDGPLHIWGSSVLLQTLIAAELVDEYQIAANALRRAPEDGVL
jgi:dihydrofolate reductase